MVDFFAEIKEYCKNLQPDRKRNISICFVGITLLLIVIMPGSPELAPAVKTMRSDTEKEKNIKTGFHEGPIKLPPQEAVRDPFAIPQDFAATKPDRLPRGLAPNQMPGQLPTTVKAQENKLINEALPVLTGIMEDSKTQVAIIRYKGVSRSYRIGQAIGQYQLVAINEKTVTVWGPQGERVLLLGR